MELLERFSDEQVLQAKAYRGEVPARVHLPYLRPHDLLTPAQRERRNDDGGHLSCPKGVVCRDVVHIQLKGRDQHQAGYSYKIAGHVLVRIRCAMARSKCL